MGKAALTLTRLKTFTTNVCVCVGGGVRAARDRANAELFIVNFPHFQCAH